MNLQLPIDELQKEQIVRSLHYLKAAPEFQIVINWLYSEQKRVESENSKEPNEINFRWNQGACQCLASIFDTVSRARELRK